MVCIAQFIKPRHNRHRMAGSYFLGGRVAQCGALAVGGTKLCAVHLRERGWAPCAAGCGRWVTPSEHRRYRGHCDDCACVVRR
jgi:hypothetical protein